MKPLGMMFLCLLFSAPAQAAGITSFEPDTTRVRGDREPMVDTPIWLGSGWTMGSLYRADADGLWNGPLNFAGYGFGATWPWKSSRQGYAEWHYGVRHIQHEVQRTAFVGGLLVPWTDVYTESVELFAVRGGAEHRFGRRQTPWCTAGGGIGFAFNAGDVVTAAYELTARTTLFAYPTENARVGLMLSAGPTWFHRGRSTSFGFGSSNGDGESALRTNFALTLRFERRLRFPKAVADAEQ